MQDNNNELSKTYDPKLSQDKWYALWEEKGFFKANAHSPKPPYCIVIPPPNVTGSLHMGHALVNTIQDILIRWKRMSGFEALWVPGTDHAGIATQTVVERHLMKTEGKRRDDYSREEFLERVWNWKEKHEERVVHQLKKLGCSCDWSRLHFTMDASCSRAVRVIFKKLFDEGLIYRGDYLVNWDPVTQTALADDEVEYEERASNLWTIKYHLIDSSDFLRIATTRPETLLGDTAVAVSPNDPRYRHLIGKKVRLPIVGRELPIIADHHVDPNFGTGVVKITPAHDPNDYRIGLEHRLDFINILTPDGRINENGRPFQGLSREEARITIVEQLKTLGLLDKVEHHMLRVGVSYRSKAVIEPYLSKQWFVKMGGFTHKLKEAVTEARVRIVPKTWETTYFHWIDNLRDWCISRQLWWGHRIPVWYRKDNPEQMLCYDGEGIPPEIEKEKQMWVQDSDVLDTWFSSALWPFSTLGWPDNTAELNKFYPTNVLVTGHDILFFWVARMILMGEYALGKPPFPATFLHGLIYGKSYWKKESDGTISYVTGEEKRDYDMGKPLPPDVCSKWEKLSKSKGNVIDPLEMIEEYGTDAVRMSLTASANQYPQIDLDRRKFEEFKNFANKIWNGARFVLMNLTDLEPQALQAGLDRRQLKIEDLWLLSSLNRLNDKINTDLENYALEQAAHGAYDFFWKEFCAYYVEIAKPYLFQKRGSFEERQNKQKLLLIALLNMIRLLHPMAPFITEELFQTIKARFNGIEPLTSCDPYTQDALKSLASPACMVAPYPTLISREDICEQAEQRFRFIEQIVYAIRNIRGEMKIPPALPTDLYLVGPFEEDPEILRSLVKLAKIEQLPSLTTNLTCSTALVGSVQIAVPLPKELAAKELVRLTKEREKLHIQQTRLNALLANPDFLEKATADHVQKQQLALQETELQLATLNEKIAQLE